MFKIAKMLKLAELANVLFWLFVAGAMAFYVLPMNPDFRLENIGLMKVFYLALMNLVIWSFILTLGGFKENALKGIPGDPVAKALFLAGYMIATALVIGT